MKDAKPLSLSSKEASWGRQSVNSVVYFASIPLPLGDPGVHANRLPDQQVEGIQYQVLEVGFSKENGGDYPNDVFRYWIEPQTGYLRYLGYRTEAGKGRVRFRVLKKRHKVAGIVFSDWDNYGLSEPSIPLGELPKRWAEGRLPKISEIVLTDIKVTDSAWAP